MVDCYLGEIRLFAGKTLPAYWQYCNGALLPINDYQALFSLIGTCYGGDGRTTFALPDLRSRLPIGQSTSASQVGLVLAQQLGAETETLTLAELAPHDHTLNAVNAPGTSATPSSSLMLANATDGALIYGQVADVKPPLSPGQLNANTIGTSVGGGAHANIMPVIAINYIIATVGLYPTN